MRTAILTGKGKGRTLSILLSEAQLFELVVCPSGAPAKALAELCGLAVLERSKSDFSSREAYERELAHVLQSNGIELVVLCGFMHLLSGDFVASWPNRILNLHPALLPAFPGKDPQAQALAYGVKMTGTTVHFVAPGTDDGPIIAQGSVRVFEDDTLETLSERLRVVGAELLLQSIKQVQDGVYQIEGRRVRFPRLR